MTVFRHGVASFEPTSDSVLIWTRLSGVTSAYWVMSTDPQMAQVVARGRIETGPDRDYTTVVEVTDLKPATTYWYRFGTGSQRSPVGRTRTLPAGDVSSFTIGMVSCARYSMATLTVYRALAQTEVDLVLHLGDYIYEDEGDKGPRAHDPPRVAISLDDYRRRLAQIRTDPDCQALHLRHPMMVMWDDHDFADNAGLEGAKAHDPAEHGPWTKRRDAAAKAHLEWLPRRSPSPDPLVTYRSAPIGDLAELILLDSRIIGRDDQASHPGAKSLDDPTRSLLGSSQLSWLRDRLQDSRPWALVASTVVVNPIPLELPLGRKWSFLLPEGYVPIGERILRDDLWDGYPAERRRLTQLIAKRAASGLQTVLLSGDVHSSWAFEGPLGPDGNPVCVEVTVPSVSSAPLGRTRLPGVWRVLNRSFRRMDHVRWAEITKRGFAVVQVQPDAVKAGWWFVDPHDPSEDPQTRVAASFKTTRTHRIPGWENAPPPALPSGRRDLPQPMPPRPDDARYIRRWHKRRRFLVLALLDAVVGIVALGTVWLARRLAARLRR